MRCRPGVRLGAKPASESFNLLHAFRHGLSLTVEHPIGRLDLRVSRAPPDCRLFMLHDALLGRSLLAIFYLRLECGVYPWKQSAVTLGFLR